MTRMTSKVKFLTLLVALLAAIPSFALAEDNTMPICTPSGVLAWQPGFVCGFVANVANIENRQPALVPNTPPSPVTIGSLGLNTDETVFPGEVLSLLIAGFPSNGAIATGVGPADTLNGLTITVNDQPVQLLYVGYRRDGAGVMRQDNVEVAFAMPADLAADSEGNAVISLTFKDAKGNVSRGQNSPFKLKLDVARAVVGTYELVYPLRTNKPELRFNGLTVTTFPKVQ